MSHKLPLLIQEKLDFYDWWCRQKEVIKGYYGKCKRLFAIHNDTEWLRIHRGDNFFYYMNLCGNNSYIIRDWLELTLWKKK